MALNQSYGLNDGQNLKTWKSLVVNSMKKMVIRTGKQQNDFHSFIKNRSNE